MLERLLNEGYGFTLLELLVVIAIVGILGAIAIPEMAAYRERAFDVRAQLDLRHVALAEEVYYLDTENYFPCAQEECTALPGVSRLSAGTQLIVDVVEESFRGESHHVKGSGRHFVWDSSQGGLLADTQD